jgi:hypothetical protein
MYELSAASSMRQIVPLLLYLSDFDVSNDNVKSDSIEWNEIKKIITVIMTHFKWYILPLAHLSKDIIYIVNKWKIIVLIGAVMIIITIEMSFCIDNTLNTWNYTTVYVQLYS